MTSGPGDTKIVKSTIGERIKKARKDKKLSRSQFAEKLNELKDRPVINNIQEEMNPERLKQWEYGNNPINLEWIPAMCKVLDCDVGYLFGEYDAKHYVAADIQKQTGLSEQAVTALLELQKSQISTDVLSSLLIQPDIKQWFFQIYRIAGETYTYQCLKEKAVIERTKMDDPRITTTSEFAIERVVGPELESAELQEWKRHNKLIEYIVKDLCTSNMNIQEFGCNNANIAVNRIKTEYKLED